MWLVGLEKSGRITLPSHCTLLDSYDLTDLIGWSMQDGWINSRFLGALRDFNDLTCRIGLNMQNQLDHFSFPGDLSDRSKYASVRMTLLHSKVWSTCWYSWLSGIFIADQILIVDSYLGRGFSLIYTIVGNILVANTLFIYTYFDDTVCDGFLWETFIVRFTTIQSNTIRTLAYLFLLAKATIHY